MSVVVLMGVCGSGRSPIGLALAKKFGGVFLDVDIDQPVEAIVSTIIRELNLATQ